ncbi:glycosyltransferase family 4 protein [Auriscalpium vulgare]|uniref:Glycosyltransferase family 4 protein n=1 Tax=Auriscalpium vulgare TaxID=40419 RepID=A0ACB8RUS7_9AGAM|nr:glycosyltransferase family 4 protein [Auriscalpium vulgare]
MVVLWTVVISIGLSFVVDTYIYFLRRASDRQRDAVRKALTIESSEQKKFIGFFHPYCNAGGGGERVLWTAIASMQRKDPSIVSVVYSGDVDVTKGQILEKVKSRFDITLSPDSLHFVFLKSRRFVEDSNWPRFTLLGQSLGSMYLAWEAMSSLVPDLFIDTMGYAFTFHVVALLTGVRIGAYVHYPTISTDMLARVQTRRSTYANSSAISSSSILSRGKLLYYRIFMYHYSLALRRAAFLMVNSSWTKNHVDSILKHSDPVLDVIHFPLVLAEKFIFASRRNHSDAPAPVKLEEAAIVYPPCDTREMSKSALEGRERLVISIAQFRPEKDHATQIYAMHELARKHPDVAQGVRLVLIGGVRNTDDMERVARLRALVDDLNLTSSVEFVLNAPYPKMLEYLSKASVGLNTMVDEHFGINVVEFMAAGVIPIVHASGGPLNDIVVPVDGQRTGFHAKDPESFADAIYEALTLSPKEELVLRQRARDWALKTFSEDEFERGWEASQWSKWM